MSLNICTYVNTPAELEMACSAGVAEVILAPKISSRLGQLSSEELITLAQLGKRLGMPCVLEWDVLSTENDFGAIADFILSLDLGLFKALRVQDAGAVNWALDNTDRALQLVLETGNHNLSGLKAWKEFLGERLDRMVLSIELTRDKLSAYKKELGVEVEFLVMGRILLFYTPRNLLSALLPEDDERRMKPALSAIGESEESPHKGFPVVENSHGTFMFHIKRQFLMQHLDELDFIDYIRIDLRKDCDFSLINSVAQVVACKAQALDLKLQYGVDVMKGFYKVNKSDVLFKKLKNYRIQRNDENYIGEVLEMRKTSHLAVRVKSDAVVNVGDVLSFITPEGKRIKAPVKSMFSWSGDELSCAQKSDLFLMNYVGGVWNRSQVYLEKKDVRGE